MGSFKKFAILQDNLPNVPVLSWLAKENTTIKNKPNCSIFPSILEIEYRNKYWQIFHSQDATYHLYGAYFGKNRLKYNRTLTDRGCDSLSF